MTRCSFPDCRNPAFQKSTGLCRSHVSQLGRTGELKPLRKYRNAKPQSPDGLCIKPGCNDAAQSRGLCPKHLWAAHPRRNPNKKPITIMPSESAISKVVKPKPLPPPSAEHEAEIQRLRAEVAQLQRMLTAAEEKPRTRRGPRGQQANTHARILAYSHDRHHRLPPRSQSRAIQNRGRSTAPSGRASMPMRSG